MNPIIKKLLLALVSILLAYLSYSLLIWGLDIGSSYFGLQSAIGSIIEKSLFWLSHFGLGLIMLPVIAIIMFYYLNKRFINNKHKQRE